ncbi:hypothetical protein J8F10_03875 [Gemmata sp. G18]|uniref:Exo-alpha-sialidase n=1 Tax=Gemmata palustris TaxID=2822762 RepID=A0ABS5BL66_9BACT|nr:hypothetical protein [Gemmata palustris]MBP3954428.1 hypothetical protein [Gemmata palustris]
MSATSTSTRSGWVKYLALLVLAAGGLGGGLFLAGQSPNPPPGSSAEQSPTDGSAQTSPQRFPLTAADAPDTLEAPVLAADATGRAYAAWASRTGDNERTLFLARSEPGRAFDAPKIVARSGVFKSVSQMKGKTVTRELRMVPHLSAFGQTLQLAWTETLPGGTGVRTVATKSEDNGGTFAPLIPLHQGTGARPTFTAFTSGPDGALLGSWLDNRNGAQQCYAAVRRPGQTTFDPELVVHSGDDAKGVCPCCPTAALLTTDGTAYVAFRNVANGFRDIAIGVKKAGATGFDLHLVVPPTWEFNGCPHDGPSLARVGDTLHVVWMDARTGSQRCYHASAKLADMVFTARELHPGAIGTQGNAKLFLDAAGTLHAVWEESMGQEAPPEGGHRHEPVAPKPGGGGGRAVMYRALPTGATQFGEARAVAPKPGAFQTRPAVAVTSQGDVLVAWNELDEAGKAVIVTRLGAIGGK